YKSKGYVAAIESCAEASLMKGIDEIKSTSEYETDGRYSITQVLMPTIKLCHVFLEGLNVTEAAHENSPPVTTSYIVEELKLKNSYDT
uniref:Uncharacterized protein n=1 Tax=Amphimedon queenslandica TaxID=400682 RepID=A0A1X7TJ18_AMPQE